MILELIERCKHLKFRFTGVFAADNFPKLVDETFMIVNASEAVITGSHWLLLCKKQQEIYFADPLGLPIQSYIVFYKRLTRFYNEVIQLFKLKPIQNSNSKLCGLFCIYIAHVIFELNYPYICYMNDDDLLRFAKHML